MILIIISQESSVINFLSGNVIYNHKNPNDPAKRDAIKTEIFELTISIFLLNAKSVMNIDIVKPIPASSPTPIICFFLISFGIEHKPIATPKTEKIKIPKGFPNNNPRIIP